MKARLVPDGYDPTQEEFPLRGPTLRGCLVKLGCLGSITAIAAVVGIMMLVAASAQSQESATAPTLAVTPTWTPEASATPITIYLAGTPYPTYTPYPTQEALNPTPVEITLRMVQPTVPARLVIEVVTGSLKVRSAPSAQAEQLGLLTRGGRVIVDTVSFDGYWLGFQFWGRPAWIGSDESLVKIVEGEKRGLPVSGVTYAVTQVPVSQTTPTAAPTASFP